MRAAQTRGIRPDGLGMRLSDGERASGFLAARRGRMAACDGRAQIWCCDPAAAPRRIRRQTQNNDISWRRPNAAPAGVQTMRAGPY